MTGGSQEPSVQQPRWRKALYRLADIPFLTGSFLATLGFLVGVVLHQQMAPDCFIGLTQLKPDSACRIQGFFIATTFAFGFVLPALGISAWVWVRDVGRRQGESGLVSVRENLGSLVLAFAVVAVALLFTPTVQAERPNEVKLVVPIVAVLLAVPYALVFDAIRQVATRTTPDVSDLAGCVGLRRRLRSALTIVGGYLALSILTVGAYSNLPGDPGTSSSSASSVVESGSLHVLLFGAFYTALLAAYYLPARSAVDRLARKVHYALAPLPESNGDDLKAELDVHVAVGNVLTIDEPPIESLKQAVMVSAPLLTGVISALIPN